MKRLVRLGAAAVLATGILPADISYTQTTKFEGGTLIDMMQHMVRMPMVGRGMKQAVEDQTYEDQTYDVFVKGNKMARWGKLTSTIYDLNAGTMTTLDNAKQTCTTWTFFEMQQHMQQMQQRMNFWQTRGPQFDVKVVYTGQTRVVNGATAKEMLLTMTAKQASAQGQMVVTMHAWMVPHTPGSKELIEFQNKLSAKDEFTFSAVGPGMASAETGINAAMREAAKQDGYAALTDTAVTGVVVPGQMGDKNSDPNAPLIKMQVDNSNFKAAAVNDKKFAIPAGFKEEPQGMY